MNKRSLGARVYGIADNYGIEQTSVGRIIATYISTCKEELASGREVRILGLVSLVPDTKSSDFVGTLAWIASVVASKTGYTYHTVLAVVKEYISSTSEDLFSGKSVDIRGLVSLHPIVKEGVVIKVHSSISTTIGKDLKILNGDVTSVRAHTCKLLKYSIACVKENKEVK